MPWTPPPPKKVPPPRPKDNLKGLQHLIDKVNSRNPTDINSKRKKDKP